MDFFKRMNVYTKVDKSEMEKAGCRPVTTKWIDTNKGDEHNPNYRARLVGREIKMDNRLDLFAGTPPLESLRMVTSICASNQSGSNPFRIMTVDVKRAYFYATADRPVSVKLPPEDYVEGMCGRLNKAMYGTRGAASNWEQTYRDNLEKAGFAAGGSTPCA